jgi:proton glutamate symport protein
VVSLQVITLPIFLIVRWTGILLLSYYAAKCQSLAAWIAVGMAAGAKLGHDWPGAAVHLQVLATIFLRLVKTIIAPKLFATLVVGIAGHTGLKKIGRMGAKALLYFEVVSTFALLIGFAAIHISRAGVGVPVAPTSSPEVLNTAPHGASELIATIFPENIAKSVAEGQVLQVVVFSILFGMALAMVPEPQRRPFVALVESLSQVMFQFTNIVMLFAQLEFSERWLTLSGTWG